MAQDWIRELEELQRQSEAAKNDLQKMYAFERDGDREAMGRKRRQAKTRLRQVGERLPALEAALEEMGSDPYGPRVTPGELDRRRREFKRLAGDYSKLRDELTAKKRTNYGHFGGGRVPVETEATMGLSNQEVQQLHRQKERDQDQDLDEILAGTKRLREIGYDINVEIDRHGGLLDDIDHEMDRADNKIGTNIQRVEFLNKKSKDKGCCCLMLLLFLAIVGLVFYDLS